MHNRHTLIARFGVFSLVLCSQLGFGFQASTPERTFPPKSDSQSRAELQIAVERGNPEAPTILGRETPQLTPNQISWVSKLKAQFARGE